MQCSDGTECFSLGCRYGGCQGRRPTRSTEQRPPEQIVSEVVLVSADAAIRGVEHDDSGHIERRRYRAFSRTFVE